MLKHTTTLLALLAIVALTGCPDDNDNNANNTNNTNNQNNANNQKDMTTEDMTEDMVKDETKDIDPDQCVDTTIYPDADGDGQGVDGQNKQVCLKPDETPEAGFSREKGDCADDDPSKFEGAEGICGDNVDDNCDGNDEACPTSMPAQMDIPNWDCTGTPPENVLAHATLGDQKYFGANSCFYFFEAKKGTFYVKLNGFERQSACTSGNGCCAEFGGYDNRLYAFTKGAQDPCEDIVIEKSGGGQPVSNDCRKYLYQMNNQAQEYSYVASDLDSLKARLSTFSSVEVACVRDTTLSQSAFPFGTLATANIVMNDAFKAK